EARKKVMQMEERLRDTYHFYIASEGGIEALDADGHPRYFIRSWTVVRSPLGESWGSSGAIQLPERLVAGLDSAQIPFAVPGTRRSGGITSSLTGGLETRRKTIALSTFHALSTLFYGVLESRPLRSPFFRTFATIPESRHSNRPYRSEGHARGANDERTRYPPVHVGVRDGGPP